MTIPTTKVTFSYKNYFKPTPKNFQYLSESIEALCGTLAVLNYFQSNEGWTVFLVITAFLSNKASKFFGKVIEEEVHEQDPA